MERELALQPRAQVEEFQRKHRIGLLTLLFNLLPAEEWVARVEAAGLRVVAQRRYFSAAATAWLELLHYEGWHNLIVKAVTGRWVLWRWRPLFCVPEAVVSRFMGLRERDSDSCLYLEATKAEDVH